MSKQSKNNNHIKGTSNHNRIVRFCYAHRQRVQSQPWRCCMKLYACFDRHSSNNYLGIVDEDGKRVFKRKLYNDREVILNTLAPYKDNMSGIVVESTYNWYWLVDILMEEGYKAHLANTTKIQKYSGLKHSDDQHDAFWLAEMLRLGFLPEGYIYPKEGRPIRDLLRKRSHLVRLRTSLIVSLQNIISRNNGFKLKVNDVKTLTIDHVTPYSFRQRGSGAGRKGLQGEHDTTTGLQHMLYPL